MVRCSFAIHSGHKLTEKINHNLQSSLCYSLFKSSKNLCTSIQSKDMFVLLLFTLLLSVWSNLSTTATYLIVNLCFALSKSSISLCAFCFSSSTLLHSLGLHLSVSYLIVNLCFSLSKSSMSLCASSFSSSTLPSLVFCASRLFSNSSFSSLNLVNSLSISSSTIVLMITLGVTMEASSSVACTVDGVVL